MPGDLFSIFNGAAPAAPFVVVTVPCVPEGKRDPPHRVIVPKRGRPFAQTYKHPADQVYETMLAWHAKAAMRGKAMIPAGVPVGLRLFVMIPIPKSWPKRDRDAALVGTKWPTAKPDDDNYKKSLDAFNGIVWADDCQICRDLIVKEYAERPGLIAEVYLLP